MTVGERLAREAAQYAAWEALEEAELRRRVAAWKADNPAVRPPIFQPYGVGWGRYAKGDLRKVRCNATL